MHIFFVSIISRLSLFPCMHVKYDGKGNPLLPQKTLKYQEDLRIIDSGVLVAGFGSFC